MIVSLADDDEKFCRHVKKWADQSELNSHIKLQLFSDPGQLVEFLRRQKFEPKEKMLVLLDLDFHGDKEGGLRVLGKIKKSRSSLRKIPVVIYSNTRDASEIDKSYLKLANSFVWKGYGSSQRKRFTDLISFWSTLSALPHFGISAT
jgi:CheY-like chemotaxis protein